MGLIWKNSNNATPINIGSDRICGIQLQHGDCTLSILCVYLPSSDHSLEEFSTYINELDSIVCSLQSQGPVIVAGDFNAHLPYFCSTFNQQGRELFALVNRNHLYPFPAQTSLLVQITLISQVHQNLPLTMSS